MPSPLIHRARQKGVQAIGFLVFLRVSPSTCGPSLPADKYRHKGINRYAFLHFPNCLRYFWHSQAPITAKSKVTFRDQMSLVHLHEGLQGDNKEVALYGFYHSHLLYCQSSPASVATYIYSPHISLSRPCLHGCVFDLRTCHKYLSLTLSWVCRVLSYDSLYHVKHETIVNEPPWLPHSRRLTVKGCRSKTLGLWLSWLVCPPEVRA